MALQMLDVLIGVVVIFVVFSSAASMLAELIETMAQQRGRLLERAIRQMFAAPAAGAQDAEALNVQLAAFYNSPALFALFDGVYGEGQRFRLPSEIPPERFAVALMRLARDERPEIAASFRTVLKGMLDAVGLSLGSVDNIAQDDVERVRKALAEYYSTSMQRVSGWYRRHVQWVLLGCGFGLAALMNVDTLAIIRALSVDDRLRMQLVAAAEDLKPPSTTACSMVDDACESMRRAAFEQSLRVVGGYGLPIGWDTESPPHPIANDAGALEKRWAWIEQNPQRALEKLLGLLLTGLAAALGAPYWFEMLQRLLAARKAIEAVRG